MCRKQIITALPALSLSANALAGEFSDANAVSQRLQFIAGAVEFGFDLKALNVEAFSGTQSQIKDVAAFEVTSSAPRQLAIGWDKQANYVLAGNATYCAQINPEKGGESRKVSVLTHYRTSGIISWRNTTFVLPVRRKPNLRGKFK